MPFGLKITCVLLFYFYFYFLFHRLTVERDLIRSLWQLLLNNALKITNRFSKMSHRHRHQWAHNDKH